MGKTAAPSARAFRAMLCKMLLLPPDSSEEQLKQALMSRDGKLLEWYEIRITAIEEYMAVKQPRG